MTDLTKITEPFGLLDKETQRELISARNVCEQFQVYDDAGWEDCPRPPAHLLSNRVYRLKPEPKTVTVYGFFPAGGGCVFGTRASRDTHSITFQLTEKGEPICATVSMEKL